jgi:hypothetical protein
VVLIFFSFPDENTILSFSVDDAVSDVFDVSSDGTISTKRPLDRESAPFYAFQVTILRLQNGPECF